MRKKRVRIIKKIRNGPSDWQWVSLAKSNGRYVWDDRPGQYYIEWRNANRKRRRQQAGTTPSQASEARRRKQNELVGEQLRGQGQRTRTEETKTGTPIVKAVTLFLEHIQVHSPDKPKTHARYKKVLEHFQRHLGHKRWAEAVTRPDIDTYKTKRSKDRAQQHKRPITATTINYEISVLRTFFYYLANERGLPIDNPCARYKPLRDAKKIQGRPPTYTKEETDKIIALCDKREKAIFATFLLTGLRKEELRCLSPDDVDPVEGTVRVTAKEGFSPKDYEERIIPMPPELKRILRRVPQGNEWFFTSPTGGQISHLLRRLKQIARRAGVKNATIHKFRHTYATRLLESGANIVTVQRLLGHSDLDTTKQYLNPDDELKREAASKLRI